jgi:CheY-like chemotaxis protein
VETLSVDLDEPSVAGSADAVPGRKAVLRVTDDGAGMDESTLSRAFDPFFTTKLEGVASGLGLATVYGLVRQAGGHVEAESRPGAGATFRVFLPAVDRPAEDPVPAPEREVSRRGETILLCEDDALVRDVAKEILEARGFDVLVADSPDEAIRLHRADPERIDLLLTDVVMPGMDGRQLAERLSGIDPGLRVLFVSGYAPDAIRLTEADVGASAFLAKPFTPSTLLSKVDELLDLER